MRVHTWRLRGRRRAVVLGRVRARRAAVRGALHTRATTLPDWDAGAPRTTRPRTGLARYSLHTYYTLPTAPVRACACVRVLTLSSHYMYGYARDSLLWYTYYIYKYNITRIRLITLRYSLITCVMESTFIISEHLKYSS